MDIPSLHLAGSSPVGKGKTRWVFEHPHDPDLLIKIHRHRVDTATGPFWKRWWARKQDRFLYRSGILRELSVFVDSRYGDQHAVNQHIVPVYGVADTDRGLGLVVAAARDISGQLAPTVLKLRKSGEMTPGRARALDKMLTLILDTDLLIGDLNQENIVLSQAGSEQEKFMLIDGLGERTLIPIQSWCTWAARRQKRVFVEKMRRRLRREGLL
ncbi:hypothetical protein E4656_02260 [Natronospirillum operosum]|uniref:PhoP regulatory network protein YrbL n=1 Tax=Natronospirillum operosum TaxID=2759953 RepID=A0A4Z0WBS6_9GAMM|nr:YrbL family protein [Natronospirillum operosum]TGG95264.1 hypothetical protein E4656_02260 [Natronospirillum operosum]